MSPHRMQFSVESLCAIVVGTAFLLLYSNMPTIAVNFHGLPSVLNYVAPSLLLGAGAVLILLQGRSIQLTPAIPWLVLFLCSGVVGTLLARRPGAAFEVWVTVLTEGVLIYLLVVNAVRSEKAVTAAIWAVIAASACMGLVVVHQYATSSFDSFYGGFGQLGSSLDVEAEDANFRLAGAIGEVNRFAQILAMALPLALIKAFSASERKFRLLALIASGLLFGGIIVTFSRGVLVGLVPVALLAVALGYFKLRSLLLIGALCLLVAVATPSYRDRVVSLVSVVGLLTESDGMRSADGALRGRFTSVLSSLLVFVDHPVVGVGPGQNPSYYQEYSPRVGGKLRPYPRESHSLIPQLLADWGVVGLIGFVGAMLAVVTRLYSRFRYFAANNLPVKHEAAAMLMTLTAYAGTSLFLHFSYIRYFWLMFGLAAAVALLQIKLPAPERTRSVYRPRLAKAI